MLPLRFFAVLTSLSFALAANSTKRGLVYVPSSKYPGDDNIWTAGGLTWYYNYQSTPSPRLAGSNLEFVPQIWGAPNSVDDTTFLDSIESQIRAGSKFTYILGFNEPDGTFDGGSGIQPALAAQVWINQLEPLRTAHGIKLGAPAVTGSPGGFTWLESFFEACAGRCHPDFMPIHWYGDFQGFASHIGQVRAAYLNLTMWVTEFAYAHGTLEQSETMANTSFEYLDRLDYVERYSYFGSFRSDVSNVGPNAAMLTQDGKLTDIGSWYLGRASTGNIPKGAAGKLSLSAFWLFGSGLAVAWVLF